MQETCYNGCAQRNHPTSAHVQCQAKTKKGKACPHHADRQNGGKPVCHVHDADGKFQQNLQPKDTTSDLVISLGDKTTSVPPGKLHDAIRQCLGW